MASQTIEKRVEILERQVETLKTLPDRISTLALEFSQLRVEFRTGFSTIRESIDEMRAQMLMLHEDVLARFALLDEHLGRHPVASRRASKTRGKKNGS